MQHALDETCVQAAFGAHLEDNLDDMVQGCHRLDEAAGRAKASVSTIVATCREKWMLDNHYRVMTTEERMI